MKPKLVLLAVCCLVSACLGQTLEATMYLPDSLCGLPGPTCLAYNRFNQRLYVGGGGSNVIVIDCATREKVDRIDVGGRVRALACNAVRNKIYAAMAGTNIVVIDGANNAECATIRVGDRPVAVICDPAGDRVYCADSVGHTVTVIDAALDRVIATVPVGAHPAALCFDPTGAKLYCALSLDGRVAVLDAQADTFMYTVPVGSGAYALYCDSLRNKVYCANHGGTDVSVISTPNDSVVATVTTAFRPRALAHDPTRGRLYCACEGHQVTVVDCAGDTVLARVAVGNSPWDVVYNPASDRVYCADRLNSIVVIDAAADTVVKALPVPPTPCALALSADRDQVYCASTAGCAVTVIDASQDTVAATVATGCYLDFTVFSRRSNRLYIGCRFGAGGHLAVVDATSNVVRRYIDVANYGWNMCYDSSLDRIYVGSQSDSTLTAIACGEDSVLATVRVPTAFAVQPCSNPSDHKVYCSSGRDGILTVVDGVADTVITTFQPPPRYVFREVCYSPVNNLVYVELDSLESVAVWAIDGNGDTIVAKIPLDCPIKGPMLFDPLANILYCADILNGFVVLIDCIHNQYLVNLRVWGGPSAMCCDTHNDRIFVANRGAAFNVWVLSGLPTPHVDSIRIGHYMGDILYDPFGDRAYCAAQNVYVIDCGMKVVRDSFLASMSTRGYGPPAFALNPVTNCVYALDSGYSRVLMILDSALVGAREGEGANLATAQRPLFLSPNPFRTGTYIHYFSATAGNLDLTVYDATGRAVTGSQLAIKAGAGRYFWQPKNLARGIYFLKARTLQKESVVKVLLVD